MKKSELRKLVEEHKILKSRSSKHQPNSYKISERLKEIERRYFHETGQDLKHN